MVFTEAFICRDMQRQNAKSSDSPSWPSPSGATLVLTQVSGSSPFLHAARHIDESELDCATAEATDAGQVSASALNPLTLFHLLSHIASPLIAKRTERCFWARVRQGRRKLYELRLHFIVETGVCLCHSRWWQCMLTSAHMYSNTPLSNLPDHNTRSDGGVPVLACSCLAELLYLWDVWDCVVPR